MTRERTCLCSHDVLWHGIGMSGGACKFRAMTATGADYASCHCQGFRTVVPGNMLPETDMLQMFWRLEVTLSRIEALLDDRLPKSNGDEP